MNIIKRDNKYIIQKIKNCICSEKESENYILVCTIKERGTHTYSYKINQDYIARNLDLRNILYLSDEAKKSINIAIDEFDKETVKFSSESLDYLRIYGNCYSLLMRNNGNISITPFCTANELAHKVLCDYDDFNENKKSLLKLSIKKNDRLLTLRLKAYYNEATNDEIRELEKLIGARVLPTLSSKFNKDYSIIANTIDFKMLDNSGYRILHRPYFAMNGSTHDNYSLNPHIRRGIDAAKITEKAITFNEYLELF